MIKTERVVGDRFVLERKLGVGGFGEVYRAFDKLGNRRVVALKLLHPHMLADAEVRRRFSQEAEVLAKLDHPGIARAIAFEVEGDAPYLAMEYVDGKSLDMEIRACLKGEQAFDLVDVDRIMGELVAAVDYAHQDVKVVHRDLKPRNIMLLRRRSQLYVKVLDFGVAKMLEGGGHHQTTDGRALGSLLYMSPEQVATMPLDYRSDVFALGVILFELLTLRHPWVRKDGLPAPFTVLGKVGTEENNTVDLITRIAREPRPKLTDVCPDLPPDLNEVLEKVLATKPENRFSSAPDLILAFRKAAFAGGGVRAESQTKPLDRMSSGSLSISYSALRPPTPTPLMPPSRSAEFSTLVDKEVVSNELPPESVPSVSHPDVGSESEGLARNEDFALLAMQGVEDSMATVEEEPSVPTASPFVTSRSGNLPSMTTPTPGMTRWVIGAVGVSLVLLMFFGVGWWTSRRQTAGVVKVSVKQASGTSVVSLGAPNLNPSHEPRSDPSSETNHEPMPSGDAHGPAEPEGSASPLAPPPDPDVEKGPEANLPEPSESKSGPVPAGRSLSVPEPVSAPPPPPKKYVLSWPLRRAIIRAKKDDSFENLEALAQAILKELDRLPANAPSRDRIERLGTSPPYNRKRMLDACRALRNAILKTKSR